MAYRWLKTENKYYAKKITIGGMTFDSHKEYERWCELKMLQKCGEITNLQRQVPFELLPSQKGDGRRERPVRYIADFIYQEGGKMVVEDAKSPATRTKEYVIKRKLMLYRYGITVKEV